ncbi:MAG: glycosyltransferase family 4 protein [Reyranellaceae bacterium]
MRIAYYTPLKSPAHRVPSGDRTMARALRDLLRRAGHEVVVLSRPAQGGLLQGPEFQASRRLQVERDFAPLLAGEGGPFDLWFTYHVYYKVPDWIGPRVAAARRIPYVMAEVSYAPKRAGGPWDMGHRQVGDCIRAADLILNLNPIDANCVRPLLRADAAMLDVPPFLAAQPYRTAARRRELHAAALRARVKASRRTPLLLCVAMMRPGDKLASYKVLGAALATLLDRDWRLVVAGDGEAQADVRAALKPLGRRVHYLGRMAPQELPALYAAADLYVWPAINEAWGMTLLEAQAAALPVVAGRTGGVPNVVDEGRTGLLPAVGDAQAFAASVARLLDDEARRATMGVAAAAWVKRRHDIAAVRDMVDAALQEARARKTS